MGRTWVAGLAALAAAMAAPAGSAAAAGDPAAGKPVEIRIATLAPRGSAWAKAMDRSAREVAERTAGRVRLKYYYGGTMGDEKDFVHKMKLGQLDGAAVTNVGLQLIRQDVQVLVLPFLFRDDRELDYVRARLQPDLEKGFEEAGYLLLAWGDVGWVHYYSTTPLATPADIKALKMWIWPNDASMRALFGRLRMNAVPLGLPDVQPSLSTGLINGCYGPTLAAIAFQWYTRTRYVTAVPISYSVGAVLVRKEVEARLTPGDRQVVREVGRKLGDELIVRVRKDNERGKAALTRAGLTFVAFDPELEALMTRQGRAVWDELAGKVYSRELLAKTKKYLAEARAGK